ncbi:hypothetical protein [Sphingorhabdus sp.]|jgi:hypothetical protein|uniref:hypothetical protein n=1 Tax=Sphingorhabdus sp. TaxID=1902408 RepID=UPI0037CC6784
MSEYQPALALREHMLEGHRVSLLEAILLFGVQGPNAEFGRMKKEGFIIKNQRVPMAKIIIRINKFVSCSVPDALPYREIQMTEYWISR